jgi:leucyl-tRNA synthetase
LLHKTIKKVGEDIENLKFNTAVSALMVLVNEMEKQKKISLKHYSFLLILLSPFAPHLAEELWQKAGNKKSIFLEKWPEYDKKIIKDQEITLVVQVNGKVRDTIETEAGVSEKQAKEIALASPKIQNWLKGKTIKKTIFVPDKLLNLVI